MKSSDSGTFTCNICGSLCELPAEGLGRETPSCANCGSSVRVRAIIAILSEEMFGVAMTLPEFPVMKGIRGIGMSDSQQLASRLAEKFDYTNTFYHQAPKLDVTAPDDGDRGRYDFLLSSEVMKHVPPPVERAFSNLYSMLKPDGLLLMTVPYSLDRATAEHFPELHQYSLAAPGDRVVLVNRRKDGTLEVFEDLVFHGGDGSTLEMRRFSETALRGILTGAGFDSIRIASEGCPEFGVRHAESWSLPIVARKGQFSPPTNEMSAAYRDAWRRAEHLEKELATLRAEYQKHVEFHNQTHDTVQRELQSRVEWVERVESQLEERTAWAKKLERESQEAEAAFIAERDSLRARLEVLERELVASKAALEHLHAGKWTRLGRRLGLLD